MQYRMKKTLSLALFLGIATVASSTLAQTAMLRVACEEDARDADVFVNGEFKGQCSVDVPVPGSSLQVRVVKAVDELNERIFEQSIRLAPNTVKRVDVVLGPRQPNERARQLAVEQTRLAEVVRQQAETGDVIAMLDLARRYENGQGLPKTPALAHEWARRAANSGNLEAQYQLARQFENGIGVTKNLEQASSIYLRCANLKNANCVGAVAAIEQRNFQEATARAQRCSASCQQIPEINQCVQDAKNLLGDTMVWNIEPRQKCIDAAYENCMSPCSFVRGRGRIGVELQSVSMALAESIGLSRAYGALVHAVVPSSPAEKAGVESGDVIIKFDGKLVETRKEFVDMVGAALPSANRAVTVLRRGKAIELNVTIGRGE
jgi:hypothetical protein